MAAKKSTAAQQARERARLEREAAAAKARRQKSVATIVIVAVVVVVLAGMGALIWWQKSKTLAGRWSAARRWPRPTPGRAPPRWPPRRTSTRRRPVPVPGCSRASDSARPSAPVTVEVFQDFSCPHCQELSASGVPAVLDEYVKSGDIRSVTYPMSLPMFGPPSELAANAFACSAVTGKAAAYEAALYSEGVWNQQWTAATLIAAAKQAGIEDTTFNSCVRNETYSDWAKSINDYATLRGVAGTPTVMVNGAVVPAPDLSADGLRSQIEAAVTAAKK